MYLLLAHSSDLKEETFKKVLYKFLVWPFLYPKGLIEGSYNLLFIRGCPSLWKSVQDLSLIEYWFHMDSIMISYGFNKDSISIDR